MKNIVNTIENSEYFKGFNAEMIESLMKISRVVYFKKGENLFWEGNKGIDVFMGLSGKIKIFKISASGKEFIIKLIKCGDFFAESLLFDKNPVYPANAVANDNSSVLAIDLHEFERLLTNNNSIAVEIIKNLSKRLSYLSQRFENLIIGNSVIKVAFFLFDLSRTAGVKDDEKIKIKIEMSREAMADMMNLSRENVERTLGYFQSSGLIVAGRKYITIIDPDKLKALAFKE